MRAPRAALNSAALEDVHDRAPGNPRQARRLHHPEPHRPAPARLLPALGVPAWLRRSRPGQGPARAGLTANGLLVRGQFIPSRPRLARARALGASQRAPGARRHRISWPEPQNPRSASSSDALCWPSANGGGALPTATCTTTPGLARAHARRARGRPLRNRLALKAAMERHGFSGYWREWWHFEHCLARHRPSRPDPGVSAPRTRDTRVMSELLRVALAQIILKVRCKIRLAMPARSPSTWPAPASAARRWWCSRSPSASTSATRRRTCC